MKLSISNIAWPREEEDAFLQRIKEWGCSGVEIAPSRIWAEPLEASKEERFLLKSSVRNYGLEVSSLHALLYGRKDLGLFRDRKTEIKTIEYLKGICRLAADLDARVVVFGSPSNRRRANLPLSIAFEKAAHFFSEVAVVAEEVGVCICIEPLGPKETDFINTASEGLKLVEMVNRKGFGLHLDAKAVAEEGSDFLNIFKSVVDKLKHFHINDPGLNEVNSTGAIDHISLGRAIKDSGYNGYVSIEMKKLPDYYNAVKRSLEFARRAY